jgi:outer membrane receptor protein involved in Fe transport
MIAFAADQATGLYRQLSDPNFQAGLDYNKSSADFPGSPQHDYTDADVLQLTADYAIGEANLRYIAAYTKYEYENVLDLDYGPLVLLDRARQEEHDQVSQELLFTSATGNFVEWMAGLYYQRNTLNSDRQTKVALSLLPLNAAIRGIAGNIFGTTFANPTDLDGLGFAEFYQKTETVSAFAQTTLNFSDTFRTSIGIRFSNDEKNFKKSQFFAALDPNSPATVQQMNFVYDTILQLATPHNYPDDQVPGKRDKDHVTGDIKFLWDVTDETMVYFNVGNGYKAGGFDEDNARANPDTQEFEDETVIAYELGTKMTLWDGRARVNAALFRSEFEDVQVSSFDGNCCFVVGNAAETETQGFEADWEVLLTEELRLVGAISLLDASYKDYTDGPCTHAQNVANGAGCTQDLSGAQLQFAPDWSGNLGLEYSTELGSALELMAQLNVNFTDDQFIATDHDEKLIQKGHEKWDLLVKLGSLDSTWSVSAVVRNIFDETTFSWGNDVPLASLGFGDTYFVNIDKPRTIEIRGRYNF